MIVKNTGASKEPGASMQQDGEYEALVIILELVVTSIRELRFCESKISSLRLLQEFSEYLPADITLDRVLPYMVTASRSLCHKSLDFTLSRKKKATSTILIM